LRCNIAYAVQDDKLNPVENRPYSVQKYSLTYAAGSGIIPFRSLRDAVASAKV